MVGRWLSFWGPVTFSGAMLNFRKVSLSHLLPTLKGSPFFFVPSTKVTTVSPRLLALRRSFEVTSDVYEAPCWSRCCMFVALGGSAGSVALLVCWFWGRFTFPNQRKRWRFNVKNIEKHQNTVWNIYMYWNIISLGFWIQRIASVGKGKGIFWNTSKYGRWTIRDEKMISKKMKFDAILNDFLVSQIHLYISMYVSKYIYIYTYITKKNIYINEKARAVIALMFLEKELGAAKVPRDPQDPSPSHTFDRSSWQAHCNHLHHKSESWEPPFQPNLQRLERPERPGPKHHPPFHFGRSFSTLKSTSCLRGRVGYVGRQWTGFPIGPCSP